MRQPNDRDGAHMPIGFVRMLCMSESHESMQDPGIVDV